MGKRGLHYHDLYSWWATEIALSPKALLVQCVMVSYPQVRKARMQVGCCENGTSLFHGRSSTPTMPCSWHLRVTAWPTLSTQHPTATPTTSATSSLWGASSPRPSTTTSCLSATSHDPSTNTSWVWLSGRSPQLWGFLLALWILFLSLWPGVFSGFFWGGGGGEGRLTWEMGWGKSRTVLAKCINVKKKINGLEVPGFPPLIAPPAQAARHDSSVILCWQVHRHGEWGLQFLLRSTLHPGTQHQWPGIWSHLRHRGLFLLSILCFCVWTPLRNTSALIPSGTRLTVRYILTSSTLVPSQ